VASLDWIAMSFGIITVIVLIGILFTWRILKDRRSGFPAKDERTQRITGKASTYALLIGQYFTIALLFVNIISREFYGSFFFSSETGYALIASLLISSLSFIGLRLYFNRKGDL